MLVLIVAPVTTEQLDEIARVDARLEVEQGWELFAPELVRDWPAHTVEWYLPRSFRDVVDSAALQARRDGLLSRAQVVCITFPFPTHILTRAPRLEFVHQLPAGVSNLKRGDLWHASVPITSGRGAGNTLPIAEWAIAALFALSKDFPRALAQKPTGQLERSEFRGRSVAGKTLGVVGMGGIGREVARLGEAVGMRVLGTRRSSARSLYEMLGQCDAVVLTAQLTEDSWHLIDRAALEAMRPGAFLINVARGELIDETALVHALRAGDVGGFAADVYEGEFDHPPPRALLALDNVIMTPHTSSFAEHGSTGALEILRENLRHWLTGEPLLNQVDWARGY